MKESFYSRYAQLRHVFWGIPGLVWQILFFYLPLVFIVGLSFSGDTFFEYYHQFIHVVYAKVIAQSLLLAMSTTCLCLLIAYPLAYFLAFRAGRLKVFFLFLVILPFGTNFLLHVYAWIFMLDRHGAVNTLLQWLGLVSHPLHMLNSMFAVMIMMVYFYMPFMIMPLYSSLERFDQRLIEASLDLGASWFATVRRVLIPLSWSGIRSGFFLVFIPSFGEFAIPEFMGGDKTMFAGSVVSHLILGAKTTGAGAAFTVVSSLALIVVAGVIFMLMRRMPTEE